MLNTNLDLADQVRKMINTDKQWRTEKQELLAVNEEFATEVEQLYKKEENYLNKIESQDHQMKELQQKYQNEKHGQSSMLQDEQLRLESQIKKLTNSLENMKMDYEQLLESNKRKEKMLSNKQEDILSSQEKDLQRIQMLLATTQTNLEHERKLREAAETEVKMMSEELSRTEQEIIEARRHTKEMSGAKGDNHKTKLQNEKLSAENFEYAVENVSPLY